MSSLKSMLLIICLLAVTSCNLTGVDDTTLTFTVDVTQDDMCVVALSGSEDTLLVLDSSGSSSVNVTEGDNITVFVYIYDYGELSLYTTKTFTINNRSVRYKL